MTQDPVAGGVLLCDVRDVVLSVDEVLDVVRHPQCGGIALFIGVVREQDHGVEVDDLDYTAHPQALAIMRQVCGTVAAKDDTVRIAALHRTGTLAVGDTAVLVAASAPHRGEAFSACREVIDTLKQQVPIWKHQRFADGSDQWVGLP